MIEANNFAEPLFSADRECLQNRSYLRAMMDIAVKSEALGNPDANEEEAWLLWVAARLELVDFFPGVAKTECDKHSCGTGVLVRRQTLGRVQFCDLLIEPDGVIPHHAHHNCNGVMRIIDGEITSNNFDLLEQDVDGIWLQPSMTAWMKAGRTITLSRYRDNVHEIIAGPDGARVLDVFTFMEEDAECRYINMENLTQKKSGIVKGCWQDEA